MFGISTTYAAAPFDHAKADIILRSSDNVHFRVFKLFLSLASPFFETLFDIPQPTQASKDQEIKDGLAVVPMAEDRKTLTALLCFCYPGTLVDDPHLDVFEDVIHVLEAAKKYSFDVIEKKVRRTLSNPKILEAEPLRCFAIACRGRLREEMLLAAKYTLTQPLIPSWFKEISLITAADLLALLTYHRECGDAVYALRTDMSWIKSHYGSSQGCAWLSGKNPNGSIMFGGGVGYDDCRCPRTPTPTRYLLFEKTLQWWEDFMEETFVALRDKPCRATVEGLAEKTVKIVKKTNCPVCSTSVSEGMRGFSDLLVKKMDEVVSQVSYGWYRYGGS